jgi:hypothetical protein
MPHQNTRRHSSIEQWTVASGSALLAAAIAAPAAARAHAAAGILIGCACLAATPLIAARLPCSLRGARQRRPIASAIWVLVALIAVAQMGRLSAFMADSSRRWGSTVPDPAAADHQCMSAYVYAAELSRRGERNIYDTRWYPAFSRAPDRPPAGAPSSVDGLGPWVDDPYQYPPPFLLLPRAALAVTNSFGAIRATWFLVQGLILLVAVLLLCEWIGGQAGTTALLLVPLLFASPPAMLNLQFGQFHAMAVALAVGAMVAFERQRAGLGGACLAFAILAKIFPGVLVVVLVAQRRWRDLAWTLAFIALFAATALSVLGSDPFDAFIRYQVPRIANGDAFSFATRDGVPAFFVSRNFSAGGMVSKLRLLGVPGMTRGVIAIVVWAYTLLLLWLGWRTGRTTPSRADAAARWLALVSLAALRSPLAPSAYVVAPTLFLLAVIAGDVRGRPGRAVALGVAWMAVMGAPPLPDTADLLFGIVSQGLVVGVNVWVLVRSTRPMDTASAGVEVEAGRELSAVGA